MLPSLLLYNQIRHELLSSLNLVVKFGALYTGRTHFLNSEILLLYCKNTKTTCIQDQSHKLGLDIQTNSDR